MQRESFEKFYYAKVALGEGCGCAEHIINVHEYNRLAGRLPRQRREVRFGFAPFFRRLANLLGLNRAGRAPAK